MSFAILHVRQKLAIVYKFILSLLPSRTCESETQYKEKRNKIKQSVSREAIFRAGLCTLVI